MPSLSRILFGKQTPVDRIRAMYLKNMPPKIPAHSVLSEKEVDESRKLFGYFDRNKDKHLDASEYRDLVNYETNFNVSQGNLEGVFSYVDKNNDGRISVEEFVEDKMMSKKKFPSYSEMKEMFEASDRDNDGRIDYDEFKSLWYDLGENIRRKDLEKMFVRADKNKDKQITCLEFVDIVNKYSRRPPRTPNDAPPPFGSADSLY